MYEYICLLHTGFSKALWSALSEPKRRKRETTNEKREKGMMGTNAEREQGVMGINTQEVERNTPKLLLVFPLTLLSYSCRFLLPLQQNRAQSNLLLLIFIYFVRQFCERFFWSRLPPQSNSGTLYVNLNKFKLLGKR